MELARLARSEEERANLPMSGVSEGKTSETRRIIEGIQDSITDEGGTVSKDILSI